MNIEYIESGSSSNVLWMNGIIAVNYTGCFVSKDGFRPLDMSIGKKSKYWRVDYCHELAHLYLSHKTNVADWQISRITPHSLRIEIMCWRIAKSIINPKYWTRGVEAHIKECLRGYILFAGKAGRVNMDKLKIIELNKGIKLPK